MTPLLQTIFFQGAGALTFVGFACWVYAVWSLRPAAADWWRQWRWPLGLGLLGAIWAFLALTVHLKVLSDETNLLSVANMLALFGKASNTEMWTYYYHTFHPLDLQIPTRPLLFPLLTAIVHSLIGVRPENPFVVNFLCLLSLIALTVRWAQLSLSEELPRRAIAFFACMMSPVLLINATSGGYDLCSLLFGFIAFLLLERFVETGDEKVRTALFYTLWAFACVRYESIVALPLVAAGLWWMNRSRPLPWGLYATVGALLLPVFLARYLTWGMFEAPPGVPAFSLGHFRDHFVPFLKSFFLDAKGPYPILLHWMGLVGLALVLRRPRDHHFLTLGFCIFLFVLLLSHHFGFAGHPTQARIFLTLSFALSLLALRAFSELREHLDTRALLGVMALLTFHHFQYSLHDPLSTQLTMTREVRHLYDFLEANPDKGDLFVYDRPGIITAQGRSAISYNELQAKGALYLAQGRAKLYQRVIVVHSHLFHPKEGEFDIFRPTQKLTLLQENQITPDGWLKIYLAEL